MTNTDICNQALGRIGAKQISDFDTDQSVPGIQSRLHYEQTRDGLLRSHWWRFAQARVALVEDTSSPAFEWDNQFVLPTDMMRARGVYGGTGSRNTRMSYELEGNLILTNESAVNFRYIKQVTDPADFDSLFTEVLILLLARKLLGPLAGGHPKMDAMLERQLTPLMRQVRANDRQETNTKGRDDQNLWNDARFFNGGRIDSQLGS